MIISCRCWRNRQQSDGDAGGASGTKSTSDRPDDSALGTADGGDVEMVPGEPSNPGGEPHDSFYDSQLSSDSEDVVAVPGTYFAW